MMYKLTVLPENRTIEVDSAKPLRTSLLENNFPLKSICGGVASCGKCIAKIVSGEENLNSPTFEELRLIGNVFYITKERLMCQTYINGDVTIDISNHMYEELPPKTNSKISLRKKSQVDEIMAQRQQARQEREDNKVGGNKRPRAFKFSNSNSETK